MKETGSEEYGPWQAVSSCEETPMDGQENFLAQALAKAQKLLEMLEEEAKSLKLFDNRALMTIIPNKESLVRELVARMTSLKKSEEKSREIASDPDYALLKSCLLEIDRLNRSNQVFIENSLSYFNDFLDCVCPSNYSPKQEAPSRFNLKGLSFRKEI